MPSISVTEAKKRKYPINKFFIQTILFDDKIKKTAAIKWLKEHNYRYDYFTMAGDHKYFMQTNPIKKAEYVSKKISDHITLVFQKY